MIGVLLWLAPFALLATFLASLVWAVLAATSTSGSRTDPQPQILASFLGRLERLPFPHVPCLQALLLGSVRPPLCQEIAEYAARGTFAKDAIPVVLTDGAFLWRLRRVAYRLRIEAAHHLQRIRQLTAHLVRLQLRRLEVRRVRWHFFQEALEGLRTYRFELRYVRIGGCWLRTWIESAIEICLVIYFQGTRARVGLLTLDLVLFLLVLHHF